MITGNAHAITRRTKVVTVLERNSFDFIFSSLVMIRMAYLLLPPPPPPRPPPPRDPPMLDAPREPLARAPLPLMPLPAPPNAFLFVELGVFRTCWLPTRSPPPMPPPPAPRLPMSRVPALGPPRPPCGRLPAPPRSPAPPGWRLPKLPACC